MRSRHAPTVLLVALFVGVPLSLGASTQDAGGGDAPESWEDAIPLTTATFSGTHDPAQGDLEDWYRVAIPQGKGARIWFDHSQAWNSRLLAKTDGGTNLSYSFNPTWQEPQSVRVPPGIPFVRFAAIHPSEAGSYDGGITFLDPLPQADAGYQDDAPGVRDEAFEIHSMSIRGELRPEQGDIEDWYRFVPPKDKQLRAILLPDPSADFWLTSTGDTGFVVEHSDEAGPGGIEVTHVPSGYTGGRFGIRHTSGSGNYTLTIELHDPASPSIGALRVGPEPALPERNRSVEFDITNPGGPAGSTLVYAWVRYYTAPGVITDRYIGREWMSIPANSTTTVTWPWDTTGQYGTAYVTACLYNEIDSTRSDNIRTQAVTLGPPNPITSGPGGALGVDPLRLPPFDEYAYCLTWD